MTGQERDPGMLLPKNTFLIPVAPRRNVVVEFPGQMTYAEWKQMEAVLETFYDGIVESGGGS